MSFRFLVGAEKSDLHKSARPGRRNIHWKNHQKGGQPIGGQLGEKRKKVFITCGPGNEIQRKIGTCWVLEISKGVQREGDGRVGGAPVEGAEDRGRAAEA